MKDAIIHKIEAVGIKQNILYTLSCGIKCLNELRRDMYYISYREIK